MSLFDTTLFTASEKARLEKELNKVYRFSAGVMTMREWLDLNKDSLVRQIGDNWHKYNRRKFNNMDYAQQKAYEDSLSKKSYDLYYGDGFCIAINKTLWQSLAVPIRVKL